MSLTSGTALHGLPPFVKYDFRVRCVLLLAHVFHVLASQEPPVEVKEEPEADVKKVLSETFYYDYPELVSIPYVSSEERIDHVCHIVSNEKLRGKTQSAQGC